MEAPQVIRIKRRIDEDPVQALVVQSERRKKLKTDLVFHLARTERQHDSPPKSPVSPKADRKGRIPIVRATGAAVLGFTQKKRYPGVSTPSKRKSPADSNPQSPAGTMRISSLVPPQDIPDINHTPPTPSPKDSHTKLDAPSTPDAKLLLVPQPRKFLLAYRHIRPSRSVSASPSRRGTPVQKKSAIFMGEENFLGRTVPSYRASKRRREKKEELRLVRSKESLTRGLGSRSSSVGSVSSIVSLKQEVCETATIGDKTIDKADHSITTGRKRPRVHPKEKEEREKLRKDKQSASAMRDTGPGDAEKSVLATRKPRRQQKVSGDIDEMAVALQKMVIDYLNTQEGVINLPTTETKFQAKNLDKSGGALRDWEKVEKRAIVRKQIDRHVVKMQQDTTDGEETEEEGWVYDVYVRQNASNKTPAGNDMTMTVGSDYGVLVVSNTDDEEWFYEGEWDDGDESGDGRMSDDEDSNAEDYFTNDYPDEDEGADFHDDSAFDEGNDDHDYSEFEKVINTSDSAYVGDGGDGDDEDDMRILQKLNTKRKLGLGRRKRLGRILPDEEEYDLAEYDTETDNEDKVNNAVRRSLERGVWGLGAETGKIGKSQESREVQENKGDKMAVSYY